MRTCAHCGKYLGEWNTDCPGSVKWDGKLFCSESCYNAYRDQMNAAAGAAKAQIEAAEIAAQAQKEAADAAAKEQARIELEARLGREVDIADLAFNGRRQRWVLASDLRAEWDDAIACLEKASGVPFSKPAKEPVEASGWDASAKLWTFKAHYMPFRSCFTKPRDFAQYRTFMDAWGKGFLDIDWEEAGKKYTRDYANDVFYDEKPLRDYAGSKKLSLKDNYSAKEYSDIKKYLSRGNYQEKAPEMPGAIEGLIPMWDCNITLDHSSKKFKLESSFSYPFRSAGTIFPRIEMVTKPLELYVPFDKVEHYIVDWDKYDTPYSWTPPAPASQGAPAAGAPATAGGAAPPPPPPAYQYSVAVDGKTYGPYDLNTMSQMKASGHINAQSIVWREGLAGWLAASAIPELAPLFAG